MLHGLEKLNVIQLVRNSLLSYVTQKSFILLLPKSWSLKWLISFDIRDLRFLWR